MNKKSVLESTGHTKSIPEIADRLKQSNVSVIKEMMLLAEEEKRKGKDVVSLGVGIPFYPAPQHVHQHVINALKSKADIDKYTLFIGLPQLRQVIASQDSQKLGFAVTEDEILITPGSMAALFYSILSLINPGDEVILPSPFFASYGEQVAIAQGKVIPVVMNEDKQAGFTLDIDKLSKAITDKTKAIIINNPHNPSGAVLPKKDLMALADLLSKKSIYLITDEVYDYLVYDNIEYFNIASIKKLWPRVIRCCSLSKKYGMMGWRIGYLHTNRDLLMNILKIHDSNIVCAPHISQEAAISALTGPQQVVKDHLRWLSENRQVICRHLDDLPDLFDYIKPQGTYYVFPKYRLDLDSIEMAKKILFEAQVVTVPGIGFGQTGEYHLRLSFGPPTDDINKAFYRIASWWKKQQNGK